MLLEQFCNENSFEKKSVMIYLTPWHFHYSYLSFYIFCIYIYLYEKNLNTIEDDDEEGREA